MATTRKLNYFILTGGPGAGKSCVIHELSHRGYQTVPESARNIIRQQTASGGNATQQGDKAAFCTLLLQQGMTDYQAHLKIDAPVFFDRALPGLRAYQTIAEGDEWLVLLKQVTDAISQYRYNNTVFTFPPWKSIYTTDTERVHTFEQAVAAYSAVTAAHLDSGYKLIEVPKTTVENRVNFILSHINKS